MGTSAAALVVAAMVVAGMLLRPWRSREWQWALGGAVAAVALGVETPRAAWNAVAGGGSVYAFLAGIAILAEIARVEGVFAAIAARARTAAGGSGKMLLFLVYAAGVCVTALLSNDTTALALTPAVFAALEGSGADPLPYLYACAVVANAASFVLPFSNPANLVAFSGRLPSLGGWFPAFGLAAAGSILVTYGALALVLRARIRRPLLPPPPVPPLTVRTRSAAIALGFSAAGMIAAAGAGWNVGVATLLLSLAVFGVVALRDRASIGTIVKRLPWQILPLVAGLFVVVDGIDRAGSFGMARTAIVQAQGVSSLLAGLVTTLATAAAACAANNLPVALATAFSWAGAVPDRTLHAAVVGIDLGPNLCATGSLSTLLWLIALRREGLDFSAGRFFRYGLVVGLPALLAAAALVR